VVDDKQGFLPDFGALPAEKFIIDGCINYNVFSPSGEIVMLTSKQVREVV